MIKNRKTTIMFTVAIISLFVIFAYDKISIVFDILSPVFYACIIAYLLDGLVRAFCKWFKMKRGLSVAIVLFIAFALFGLLFYNAIPFLINTVVDLVGYVTELITNRDNGIYNIASRLAYYFGFNINTLINNFDISKMDETLVETANNLIRNIYGVTINTVTSIGSSFVIVFTSIVMSIYMLVEKKTLLIWCKRFVRAICPESKEEYVLSKFSMANDVFKRFLIGKMFSSAILGFLIGLGFVIFGVEYPVVFGLLCAFGNMIPYFGQIISTVPVVIILLIINPWHALIALIIMIVVQQLDNQLICPKVISDRLKGVSAFWIIFSVTICGLAFGVLGMFVGVPVIIVIKNLIEDFVNMRLRDRKDILKPTIVGKSKKIKAVDDDAKEQQPKA